MTAVLLLAPVAAHADAAVKAQEGEINHWIEYYEKQRAATKPDTDKREVPEEPDVREVREEPDVREVPEEPEER